MSKASNFITIAIVLFIAVILVPIVVNQVQISEQEVNTLQKSAYLYPQTDGSLATSPASSGAYTVDCSTTGNKTLKQTSITLSTFHSNMKSLDAVTWTINYNATLTNSTLKVKLYLDIYITFSNGTIRDTIKKGAGYSADLTGDTNYHALSGTYSFPTYTVKDTTDKLRIDWMVEVSTSASGNTTLSLPESKVGLVYYTYESQSEGWGFTGGSGARTLFLLLPFIFIIGIVVYFIASLLGKI
jgi:hypothetical protein